MSVIDAGCRLTAPLHWLALAYFAVHVVAWIVTPNTVKESRWPYQIQTCSEVCR